MNREDVVHTTHHGITFFDSPTGLFARQDKSAITRKWNPRPSNWKSKHIQKLVKFQNPSDTWTLTIIKDSVNNLHRGKHRLEFYCPSL